MMARGGARLTAKCLQSDNSAGRPEESSCCASDRHPKDENATARRAESTKGFVADSALSHLRSEVGPGFSVENNPDSCIRFVVQPPVSGGRVHEPVPFGI